MKAVCKSVVHNNAGGELKTVFGVLALAAAVFDISANIYRKKWKRLILDIFVCFIQMPLWGILGVAIVGIFPSLIYSYFPGIWLILGLFLWFIPHSIFTIKAIRRKDYFDLAYSLSGILTIISFCVFIYFWDLTKNVP